MAKLSNYPWARRQSGGVLVSPDHPRRAALLAGDAVHGDRKTAPDRALCDETDGICVDRGRMRRDGGPVHDTDLKGERHGDQKT